MARNGGIVGGGGKRGQGRRNIKLPHMPYFLPWVEGSKAGL